DFPVRSFCQCHANTSSRPANSARNSAIFSAGDERRSTVGRSACGGENSDGSHASGGADDRSSVNPNNPRRRPFSSRRAAIPANAHSNAPSCSLSPYASTSTSSTNRSSSTSDHADITMPNVDRSVAHLAVDPGSDNDEVEHRGASNELVVAPDVRTFDEGSNE